ncbi:MAG: CBS domain-containing protein [Planctomycetaceae bacterium]|jgi:CBS domain-containing protein
MKNISGIVASQIMHTPVLCADPEDTVSKLEDRLEDRHISGMPVVEDGRMIGIVTQNDIVRLPALMDSMADYVYNELLSSGPLLESADKNNDGMPDNLSFRGQVDTMKVRDAMRRKVITCEPTTPVQRVMELMADHNVHRIVVSEGEKPVGIISTLDILKLLTGRNEPRS